MAGKHYTYRGVEYRSSNELAKAIGIPPHTLRDRLRRGWPLHIAIETPKGQDPW